MTVLASPIFIRMVVAAVAGVAVMFLFARLMRRLRPQMNAATAQTLRPGDASNTDFTLAAYQGVIQGYKDQQKKLARQREEDRQRAATTEKVNTAVLSQLSSGVLLFNPLGLVQQANPAAKTIFGYASPLGFHARDLFKGISGLRSESGGGPGGGPATLLEILERCIRSGEGAQRLEADYSTPQGERRVLGVTLSPVRDPQGQPLGAACLVSDLTEITNLARQMRVQENLASLGEMSAGIAHEFKNSLATISGYAQMLGSHEDLSTVRDFAGKIAGETANLARVVTDFLNFARPAGTTDSGSLPSSQRQESETIEVRPLVEECAQRYDLDAHWEGASNFEIPGDRTALRQAFSNLLRNSAEAARNGERVRVEISAEQLPEGCRIVFRDNGCGIPREKLGKIFIPFFTTKSGGTGLGLALVHRIVTQHGGTIAVNSNHAGTEFILAFPRRHGHAKKQGA